MKARELELMGDEGEPIFVRFDHSVGEPQWFDATQGVGHPGCDPLVEITEVNFGFGWVPADRLMEKERDAFEAQIVFILELIKAEQQADRPEEA